MPLRMLRIARLWWFVMNDIVVMGNRSGHCIELFLPGDCPAHFNQETQKTRQRFPPARDNYLVWSCNEEYK
jgi:hypothetical protein